MENYFESQREHIFRSTEVMIYVLEVRKINQSSSKQIMKDLEQDFLYFRNTINNLKALSPEARLFCLIHKMDILSIYERKTVLQYYENEISKFMKLKKLNFNIKVNFNFFYLFLQNDS